MDKLRTEEAAGPVMQGDNGDRRLLWAVRLVAALLAVALVSLGAYFLFRQCSIPASLSVVDRDIQILENQIRERPNDPELRVAIANLYLGKGLPDDAIAQAGQVLQASPNHLGAILAQAQAYAKKGRSDLAMELLGRAIELNKDNPMAGASLLLASVHQSLGVLYQEQDRMEEAIGQFRQALEINRSDADTLYLLGKALAAQGRIDEAIQSYRQAVRFVPEFTEVYGELVRSYEEEGAWDRADYAWGMVNYSLGEYNQAIERLQKAAEAVPDMAEAHLGLGMAYEKKGRDAEAMEEYRLALAADGTSIAARHGIARLGGQP